MEVIPFASRESMLHQCNFVGLSTDSIFETTCLLFADADISLSCHSMLGGGCIEEESFIFTNSLFKVA